MSFNGSGTFLINTAGQPVVSGTVISSTAFNALTADLATGLSTCLTKDGQTTPTANIPMGSNKITGLALGTDATDAPTLSQVQSTVTKLIASVSGTDTITGSLTPSLAAYAAGQMFYFVAAGDNTGAVTLNINSLGAKNVTKNGTTALSAGDIKSGQTVAVIYDGTRFQMINSALSTFAAGTAAAPSITFTNDTNTGIYSSGTDEVSVTTGGNQRVLVNSTGEVYIKTFTNLVSTAVLHVDTAGGTYGSTIEAKNQDYSRPVLVAWNSDTSNNNTFAAFGTETTYAARGTITYNRGAGLVAYNTTSDYRAKDVYGPVTDSGAVVDSLQVYRGKMHGATLERPMMIAHEAQAVTPYAVTGQKDAVDENGNPVYQLVDYSTLVPLLLAEIQSLRARVAALES
jgi:hypothetical protein